MALSEDDKRLLKELFNRCNPHEPLLPGDPRYQPIYDGVHCEDPVARLRTHIEWAGAESLQFFSGFSGSGKTTELYRLRRDLENNGVLVLYANALDYLGTQVPVDISDMLLVVAGAFSDSLKTDHGIDLGSESWWGRITNYLTRTSIAVTEATAKIETESPAKEIAGGLTGGVELKFALKESATFRKKLRAFLENRLVELKKEVNKFIEEGVQALRGRNRPDAPIVLIFDQLERLGNEREVIVSLKRVFSGHLEKLRLPLVHVIYTVPPWLPLVLHGVDMELLPCLRLWENNPGRTHNKPVWSAARKLIGRRLKEDGYARLFGVDSASADGLADRVIQASGGHFRDLLRLIREVLLRIQTQAQKLPVSDAVIAGAIQRVRETYLPLSVEVAAHLSLIAETRACTLENSSPDQVLLISDLLDGHLILYFSNDEEWYDIHPLVRDEVAKIIQRSKK
jgi:hypothetical protein